MRKKWLVIGGVGLVVLVLLAAASQLFNRVQGNACERFLNATLENNAGSSYNLLADSVKEQISEEDWKKKIETYFLQYKSTKTTFKLENTVKNTDPDTQATTTTEEYLITTTISKVRGTCHLDESGKIKAYVDEQVYN